MQSDPFVGHLLPGVGFILLGFVLLYFIHLQYKYYEYQQKLNEEREEINKKSQSFEKQRDDEINKIKNNIQLYKKTLEENKDIKDKTKYDNAKTVTDAQIQKMEQDVKTKQKEYLARIRIILKDNGILDVKGTKLINNMNFYIKWIGIITILIIIVVFILWMVDVANNNGKTKIHRVLTLTGLPLGISMYYSADNTTHELLWRYVLVFYCIINAILYYGHKHPDASMSDMMTGEESAHQPFFWTFLLSSISFGFSQFLVGHYFVHILFAVGSWTFVVLGIWYIVAAGVLYGGAFGVDGVYYGDSTADYGIVLVVTLTIAVIVWMYYSRNIRQLSPSDEESQETSNSTGTIHEDYNRV
jgi:F0F1-type ATP synthase membrane subunit b/b'/membrane protein implicated in regulation of membrane protease activity